MNVITCIFLSMQLVISETGHWHDNDNDKQFIFRHECPYNITRYTLCTNAVLKTIMVHQEKQYKFYNYNPSSLFQYLCITLVIKKNMSFKSVHSMTF